MRFNLLQTGFNIYMIMIKPSLVIYLFLLNFRVFAQNTEGVISYKIANIDFVDSGVNADATAMLLIAQRQEYQLHFNEEKTSFTLLASMQEENYNEFYHTLAKIYVSNADYYFDYKNNDLLESRRDGTVLEQKIQKLSWVITSEIKMIDSYQCYKATYTFEYLARDNKIKSRVITAWFAPSLPYPYGPKNYHGLPGLILELTDRKVTFLASNIELSDKRIEIKLPSGRRISKDEYEKAILKN